ncbi:MAG: TauD/TfdA family dioxygenase [Cytophagales bacterium]|nr:TauD/TfdA family dioxygenase [Cytophagales bacterium]
MTTKDLKKKQLLGIAAVKPRHYHFDEELVQADLLFEGGTSPVVLTPKTERVALGEWLPGNKSFLTGKLHQAGALLFRNFNLNSLEDFRNFGTSLGCQFMEYEHRSSPRSEMATNIYTSTDYPPAYAIKMHTEQSYSDDWPTKLLFYCVQPPGAGGQTPIADCRGLLQRLNPATVQQFEQKGVMYVRNLTGRPELGLTWQEVFQTDDPQRVVQECRRTNIHYQWGDDQRLRLQWVRPALRLHPHTGERVWFNHAYFFHALSYPDLVLEMVNGEDELPFCTYYGDGTRIEESVIREIEAAYQQSVIEFDWQKGDVLVVDNMLMAHGRKPFEGARKIAVLMVDAYSRTG